MLRDPYLRDSLRDAVRPVAIGAVVVLLLAAGAWRLANARSWQVTGPLVSRVETMRPVVALTIDDGPAPALVDSVLGLLEQRGVHATFFVVGSELARAPEAGRALVRAGHELANHSWSHRDLTLALPRTVRAEVERADSLLEAVGAGRRPWFRPAYGRKLLTLPWYLGRTGRVTVTWDVEPDSHEDVAATPMGIVRHVLDHVAPGSIILLHVWHPDRATSLAALPVLLDSLHARGYRVGTVSELMAMVEAERP